jgi:hypothetical protein
MNSTISDKEKREQLARLDNEVKDFHPVLAALLPKLPRVLKVDYTHGQDEKGADFVLTRTDDTLGTPEYVGILAKVGKITQSLTTLYDQISDCNSRRYTSGGKKEIQLDEVWVVTNESISTNAQEKIHDKFATTKIKFLEHDDLIRLIDKYMGHYWTLLDVPVGEYLSTIDHRIQEDDIARSLLPQSSEQFYVELTLSPWKIEFEERKKSDNRSHTLMELIRSQKVTVVEGESGSGKSQLLRHVVREMATPSNYVKWHFLPVYVSYADLYRNHNLDIARFLSESTFSAFPEQIKDGAVVVVIVDGFDELLIEDRCVEEELKRLVTSAEELPHVKVVLATRPLNILDYRKLLPSKSPAYEINPLSLKQVMEFFQHICKSISISNRLLEDIKSSDLFKQLPRSPISAILLAQIVNDNQEDLPSNLTDVYTRYSQLMLGLWDVRKGLQSQKEFEAATNIIMRIAAYFVENDLPYIGEGEAREFFQEYLDKRNFTIVPGTLFTRTITRSGIIQMDKSNRVYFKHRSFAEYYYALGKFRQPDDKFVNHRVYRAAWRTIYFFYIGLHKDCEKLLRDILALSPKDTNERFWRYANMGEYLLAGYATPYNVVEDALPTLMLEAVDLYLDIAENKIDSPISDMPELFALKFFEAVTNGCYSYRFFLKAADSAVLSICANQDCDNVRKAYALFFLSVLYRAFGRENPFDGLLESFEKDLPLSIRVGLLYEEKHTKHASTLLKRNAKWVKHEMKKNPKLRSYTKRLLELPVGKKPKEEATK